MKCISFIARPLPRVYFIPAWVFFIPLPRVFFIAVWGFFIPLPEVFLGNSMGMGNPHGLWVEPIMGMGVGRDFSTHEFYKSLVLPKIIMH